MAVNRIYIFSRTVTLFFVFLFVSCANFKAYFNTFYNAEQYFKKAEMSRLENRGDVLPKLAQDNYNKVIEKSQMVIDEYPEFKYRKEAILMIIQSQFYLAEYQNAVATLSKMNEEYGNLVFVDAAFWSAMIKWKEGKVQPAINDLSSLTENDLDLTVDMEAKIYMAIAEIYFDQEMNTMSMDYLLKAAKIIRDPEEKGQLYYNIADISFKDKNYDRSLEAYQQVIKNSQTKKQIQEGHLRSVQIYRLQGNLDRATKSIQTMLQDENYSTIFSDLELELSKLYTQQGMNSEAKNRLESIVQDYKRSLASAEAYYLLGQYSIANDWDLPLALKHFEMVSKEHRESIYKSPAQVRIKEINAYNKIQTEYGVWIERMTQVDSTGQYILTKGDEIDLSRVLYGIAELEVFHFGRKDSGMVYLNRLLDLTPKATLLPKALYLKAVMSEEAGQDSISVNLKKRIVNEFSKTDYALAIINADSSYQTDGPTSDSRLVLAEKSWLIDPVLALDGYREIITADTISETSAKAAYFLAYQYDYNYVRPDSALKYYEWIMKYHQTSDQAVPSIRRIALINQILTDSLVTNAN